MSDDVEMRREGVRQTGAELGLTLDAPTVDRLLAFLDLLRQWNSTYNLTALREPGQMLVHHLADCLAVIGPMRRALGAGPSRVLDVGSGGGLPGAVIAATCPDVTVLCVDAVAKKVAFVRQVAAQLRLPNLAGEHARVEQLAAGAFDLITSRAFASLADFVQLTCRHLAPRGVWMAMKGKRPDAEMAALPAGVHVFHVEQIRVPHLEAERCLIWIRRGEGIEC